MTASLRTINLETAAARIRETKQQARRHVSPHFFLCGAGISTPQVPLAWAIEQECRKRALRVGTTGGEAPTDPAGAYSYWLEQAYPDADQRRAFFRRKIEGQSLSDANLRLAHLLGSGALTNIVVTPNFDDFLSRALTLFGHRHLVCDHPATTARFDFDAPDLQLVHVHGTYWFYDLINTDQEIVERAQGMRGGPGMGELLTDLLRSRVPLVVGYSGWESDVIMRTLKRRLRTGLKHRLYWFLYTAQSADSLPPWIRDHADVTFVVAERTQLPADRVFDALVRAFQLEAPNLTRDPLGFFAEQLRAAVPPQPPISSTEAELYFFDDVIHRVQHAADQAEGGAKESARAIERVRDAVRRGRYNLAARYAKGVALRYLTMATRGQLADALWPAVARGGRDAKEDARIVQTFLRIAGESGEHVSAGRIVGAKIAEVSAYLRKGQTTKAARAASRSLEEIDEEQMPRAAHRLRRLGARSLAAQKSSRGRALKAFKALVVDYPITARAPFRVERLGAERERAELLFDLGRPEEALTLLDALMKKHAPEKAIGEREELTRATKLKERILRSGS